MNTHTQINPNELHATIKLGMDAHAKWLLMDLHFHPFRARPTARPGIEAVRVEVRGVQGHLRQKWHDLN